MLRCMSPEAALRVISRQRTISVAFGAKRMWSRPLVPVEGIEPHSFRSAILNRVRLPVPPHGHAPAGEIAVREHPNPRLSFESECVYDNYLILNINYSSDVCMCKKLCKFPAFPHGFQGL
jgi:hypothetical protein